MRSATLLVAVAVLFLGPASGSAQLGDRQVGGGVTWLDPDVSSDVVLSTETRLDLAGAVGLEGSARWWLSTTLVVGASIGAAEHDLDTVGGSYGGLDGGSLWMVPVLATLQYHLPLYGLVHPYAGIGASWAWVPEVDPSPELRALGIDDLDVSASAGLAALAGVEAELGRRLAAHFEVRYAEISTDTELQDPSGAVIDQIAFDLDPWTLALGVTWRF